MAITIVQVGTGGALYATTGTQYSGVMPAAPANGNYLLSFSAGDAISPIGTSPPYTMLEKGSGSGTDVQMEYKAAGSGESTTQGPVAQTGEANIYAQTVILELAGGLAPASSTFANSFATSANVPNSGGVYTLPAVSATVGTYGGMLIACFSFEDNAGITAVTPGSGWLLLGNYSVSGGSNSNSPLRMIIVYRTSFTINSTYSASITITGTPSVASTCTGMAAAFRAAAPPTTSGFASIMPQASGVITPGLSGVSFLPPSGSALARALIANGGKVLGLSTSNFRLVNRLGAVLLPLVGAGTTSAFAATPTFNRGLTLLFGRAMSGAIGATAPTGHVTVPLTITYTRTLYRGGTATPAVSGKGVSQLIRGGFAAVLPLALGKSRIVGHSTGNFSLNPSGSGVLGVIFVPANAAITPRAAGTQAAIVRLLSSGAAYLGLIGSGKRSATIKGATTLTLTTANFRGALRNAGVVLTVTGLGTRSAIRKAGAAVTVAASGKRNIVWVVNVSLNIAQAGFTRINRVGATSIVATAFGRSGALLRGATAIVVTGAGFRSTVQQGFKTLTLTFATARSAQRLGGATLTLLAGARSRFYSLSGGAVLQPTVSYLRSLIGRSGALAQPQASAATVVNRKGAVVMPVAGAGTPRGLTRVQAGATITPTAKGTRVPFTFGDALLVLFGFGNLTPTIQTGDRVHIPVTFNTKLYLPVSLEF